MKAPLIFILILFCAIGAAICAGNKDGFNLYKDLLRGKADEEEAVDYPDGGGRAPHKVVYFYRTPAQLAAPDNGAIQETNWGKRNMNMFRNYMLARDLEKKLSLREGKRGSGSGDYGPHSGALQCDRSAGDCWWQKFSTDDTFK